MTALLTDAAQARAWVAALPDVSRGTLAALDEFAALLAAENQRQNLVAASTLGAPFWVRHIADSAQLLPMALRAGASVSARWVDLGSGPGLPGLVIAILAPRMRVTLVEVRRRRCDFLRAVCATLALDNVEVVEGKVERIDGKFDVISARAFAPLPDLLSIARHLAQKDSVWLLPKGKSAVSELSALPPHAQRMFHVEQSLTGEDARIVVGRGQPPARQAVR